jgi:hypothetical protein
LPLDTGKAFVRVPRVAENQRAVEVVLCECNIGSLSLAFWTGAVISQAIGIAFACTWISRIPCRASRGLAAIWY